MSELPSLPVLTAAEIRAAKKQVLQFWVDRINAVEIAKGLKKAINRQQNVLQLQIAIAHYFDISLHDANANDLSDVEEIPPPSNALIPAAGFGQLDHELRTRQYAGLLKLGAEWEECLQKGKEFKLLASDKVAHTRTEAQLAYQHMHSSSSITAMDSEGWQHSPPFTELYNSRMPLLQDTPPALPASGSTSTQELALFQSIKHIDYEMIKKAAGIKEALEQEAAVACIRQEFASKKNPPIAWRSISSVITRRERLFNAVNTDFNGDKEAFFTYVRAEPVSGKAPVRKKVGDDGLISLNTFTNELTHTCITAIEAERAKETYIQEGQFSPTLWDMKWKGMNKYEIFQVLALDYIEQAKRQGMFQENGEFCEAKWREQFGSYNHWFHIYHRLSKGKKD